MRVDISYVSNNPTIQDCPKVCIHDISYCEYDVRFIDNDTNEILFRGKTKANGCIFGGRQYYTNWRIEVEKLINKKDVKNPIYTEIFNPKNKIVSIKIDAFGLGDNIAWIPYVEEFRKKHNCTVICSTFFNEYFKSEYPDIIFVPPNTKIDNIYAQYYIGTFDEIIPSYSPSCYRYIPLQKVAADILGLEYKEIKPKVIIPKPRNPIYGKYVCISENTSLSIKNWNYKGGWQKVVDFLRSEGYLVFVISKEPTNLKNVIDKTGDIPLYDRIVDIKHAQFFIGCSSGLSWLSWAIGTPVVMISDFTPPWHEFESGITRVYNPKILRYRIDYKPISDDVSPEIVIEYVKTRLTY